ncbi:MAG: HEPN domain-containing protein [Oligoflexia bacterium]|nr:HEPN domain-containing protein [Oligoflexia bacterium]
MTNEKLARDYRLRARGRRKALAALFAEGLYADVVRECQEACELALKSLIRDAGHAVPMTHDVSAKLQEIRNDLPAPVQAKLQRICEISKSLRRDRELAFYGSEDVTPSDFYEESHARQALSELDEVLAILPAD